ncbi:MAG: recombinase family protein [Oscillospiraceae bacterium]|nr:recombinase family protein [Oscillospiraceae bacterium]
MQQKLNIAAYCRISVDEEMDRENTSIENQKSIIEDFVKRKFPGSTLDFYEDRDRSGYTFEQREGYQQLRPQLMDLTYDILIVKDFSRFSRRNSKGLVELEDLRDAGLRIIAIGDSIDYPTYDDWTAIQFRFLINEMPVTDTSKKVKSVIKRRQSEGKWICSVPYGYVITNSKTMAFEMDESSAEVVRQVFELYNGGWGYKKIANHLTDKNIPTPRMTEKLRKEAKGEEYRAEVKQAWSIVTISEILCNDFYIGTLRQGKYKRKKINGSDVKTDEMDHVVFENNHDPVIDYRTFAVTQEQLKQRSTSHYRGIRKNDNVYSGFIYCGDCNNPMFAMSRRDLKPAYTCGTYHSRGLKGCTSHHTRVDVLDKLLKSYVEKVRDSSKDMLDKLNESLKNEQEVVKESTTSLEILQSQIDDARQEMKILTRQQAKEIARSPDRETVIDGIYREMLDELADRVDGLTQQLELTSDRRNTIIRVNRIAKTALDIFDDILNKEKLDKTDLQLIIDRIVVYEDRIEIQLKADIDTILKTGTIPEDALNFPHDTGDIERAAYQSGSLIQKSRNHLDKVLSVHVISNGDPLEIYTNNEGEVIFKKYSPIGEIANFASQYADVLSKTGNMPAIVCDKDHVIAAAGIPKKEVLERRVSGALEDIMESRKTYIHENGNAKPLKPIEGMDKHTLVCAPIVTAGDVGGAIMFMSTDEVGVANETLNKLAQSAALFIGKQMEE